MDEEIDINYRYCTECRVKGSNMDKKELHKIKKIGDSSIVAGSKDRTVHVHIHSNKPAQVFSMCERFGDVDEQKADMFHQQQLLNTKNIEKRSVAIVTDSASDFMDDNLNIYVVPLRYSFGSKGYIDKVFRHHPNFIKNLEMVIIIHKHHNQQLEISKQYQFLSSHYQTIISLHIPKI